MQNSEVSRAESDKQYTPKCLEIGSELNSQVSYEDQQITAKYFLTN